MSTFWHINEKEMYSRVHNTISFSCAKFSKFFKMENPKFKKFPHNVCGKKGHGLRILDFPFQKEWLICTARANLFIVATLVLKLQFV